MFGLILCYVRTLLGYINYPLRMLLLVVLSVSLMACAKKTPQQVMPGVASKPKITRQMLAGRVSQLGMTIQHVGQDITIVIPSDKIFVLSTSNYLSGANTYLKAVLNYIKSYPVIEMKVLAYTDNLDPKNISLALSERQAQRVTNVLWSGFPQLRIIIAKGLGVTSPVANNTTAGGQSQNRRVEVSFRYLVNS